MVERALLVRVLTPENAPEGDGGELLDELAELVRTLGIGVVSQELVKIREPQPRYFMGGGKAASVVDTARGLGCDVIVFDNAITPAQQRNWEQLGEHKILVVDRQEIILDIFNNRAQTKEARLQVELARLEYNLPRLRKAWTHLSRQRGGGATQRDAGETQLELDQRMIRTRISRLKQELTEVVQHRDVQRRQRTEVPVPTGAIVGYTNAGKSSLLNALTDSEVLAEDKLFATLDPTSRRMTLPNRQIVVLTDTVGFVRNLPHRLVEAFKATLEEAVVANFLIHVIDATSSEAEIHARTTLQVLEELGADGKYVITVLNKCDREEARERLPFLRHAFPGALALSALSGEGLEALRTLIADFIERTFERREVLIPHDRYDLISRVYREGAVHGERITDEGVLLTGAFPERLLPALKDFVVGRAGS